MVREYVPAGHEPSAVRMVMPTPSRQPAVVQLDPSSAEQPPFAIAAMTKRTLPQEFVNDAM
jgi:hypothetical protein